MATTKWGVLSTGKISHDFVTSFLSLDPKEHKVIGVAARNFESAKAFAKEHGIEKSFHTYEDLVKDESIGKTNSLIIQPN